ncbi:hypothetical protein [Kouleothrix sp.]|uniref:hypothetical protein n=1 Tax=Kouleothrix sp. TaxID=2779161 RepID=UPI00391DA1FC
MDRRFVALICAAALALALWFTWPLAALLSDHVAGRSVDAEQFLWSFWWFREALVARHSSPFVTGMLYYPEGVSLRYFTTNTLHALLSIPLQPLLGLVPAFNLIGLAIFVATCFSMAWLAYDVTGSRAGALLAGVAFAFGPTQLFHWRVGQYNMLSVEFLPLYILALRRLLRAGGWNWRAILACAAALACAALCDWQFVIYLGLYSLLAVGAALARSPREWRRILPPAIVAGALALAVLLPYVLPMLRELASDNPYMLRKEIDTIYHSADVAEFLLPNPASPIWGGWAARQAAALNAPGIIPTVVSSSYVLLALALLGALAQRRGARFWLVVGACFWLLSLGPRLKWFGTQTDVPLPYLALFQLKLVQITRFPARYAIVTQICLAVLAAYGVATLLRAGVQSRAGRPRTWLAALAGLALVAELWPAPNAVEPLAPIPAFYNDGTLAGAGALLEQPNPSNRGMFFQTLHDRPVLWGELSRDNPAGPLLSYLREGPPAPTSDIFDDTRNWLCVAAAMHITHLVRYDTPKPRPEPPGATRLRADGGATLYGLGDPGTATTCAWLDTGWQQPSKFDDGTPYRWIGQSARFALLRRSPATVTLRLTLHCFAGPRHAELRQAGRVLAALPNCGAPQPLSVTLDLPAGWTWLELASVEPASNPADFGYPAGDPIAVGVSSVMFSP